VTKHFDERILAEQERLNARGIATAWVLPGEKMPKVKGWNRQSMPRDQHKPGANLAIQTGALSGNLVCIDIDRREVLERADAFLPYTPMVDGRPGKPRAHRYYRVTSIPSEFVADPHVAGGIGGPRTKRFGPAKIDWQGTGVCVVCPPSFHAQSGEYRVWDDPAAEPTEVDFMELWDAARDLATEFGWVDRTQEASRYIHRIKAKSGEGGSNATFHAASALVNGFLLDSEDAMQLLQTWNRSNATPCWSDDDLRHKLEGALAKVGTDPRFPPGYLIHDGRAVNDPVRLADRLPGTWRCWNGTMFRYEDDRYKMTPDGEVNAIIRGHVDREFGMAFDRATRRWDRDGKKGKPPGRQQVSRGIVGEVLASLQTRTIVPSEYEMPCSLPDGLPRQWIAFRNGILDLETTELRPHSPDWFSTVKIGYDYDPSAPEPRLAEWLDLWFGGDAERIEVAQEWVGYSLFRTTDAQAFLMACGSGGNGKGGFLAMNEAVVGRENCSFQSWNALGERFGLGPTLGKLLNIADEVGEFDRTIEGTLKWYVSGKPLAYEFKGKPIINAVPTARLMVACNTPPRISDRTDGVWRRMVLLPFTETIPADKRIPGMDKAEWWLRNANMSGVLNWALAGLARLRANDWRFTEPAVCVAAKEVLRAECNPAAMFVRETAVGDPAGRSITSAAFFDRYREWCVRQNFQPLNATNFAAEVKRIHPGAETKPRKVNGQVSKYWHGIRWRDLEIDDPLAAFDMSAFNEACKKFFPTTLPTIISTDESYDYDDYDPADDPEEALAPY
jgi:putative DNA primase/helicase